MKKICFITPYFGTKFPDYFPYFLKSAAWNESIDFIIFTDISININISNVKVVNFTLQEFNALATSKLGIDINIIIPYKLCDFKPSYGLVFEDYLTQYDFWGYCDIDVVLGNMRNFFTENVLNEYDFITGRKEYPIGSLTLYRNIEKMKNLFKESSDWKYVFNHSTYLGFDEMNGKFWEIINGIPYSDIKFDIDCMMCVLEKSKDAINIQYKTIIHEFLPVYIEGKLDRNDNIEISSKGAFSCITQNEYCLIHLVALKELKVFHVPKHNPKAKNIYVDITGIYNSQKDNQNARRKLLTTKFQLRQEVQIQDDFLALSNRKIKLEGFNSVLLCFEEGFINGYELIDLINQDYVNDSFVLANLEDKVLDIIQTGLEWNLFCELTDK
jgi:hypothetical protein